MVFLKGTFPTKWWLLHVLCCSFEITAGFLVSNDTDIHRGMTMITSNLQPTSVTPSTLTITITVCEDKIPTCSHYISSFCTDTKYQHWARFNCPLYCGFCSPPGSLQFSCKDKLSNCEEYDSGDLCTNPSYNAWIHENCRAYCKLDFCNEKLCQDSTNVDCQLLNKTIGLCADIHKAKMICKNYCGLCDLIDGQWCAWSTWGSCDNATCANGTRSRTRQCACPAFANRGLDCTGDHSQSKQCSKDLCPVHGGWSSWQNWGTCSVTCGIGLRRRDRTCSNPAPSRGGYQCFGDAHEHKICYATGCRDGGWSSWSSWGSCSVTCEGGLAKRTRDCNNPSPSLLGRDCVGNNVDYETCNTKTCIHVRLTDGNRLEVSEDGHTWGTVCNDGFGVNEAKVACRMLGYPTGRARIIDPPDGAGPILLDDARCSGSEDSLMECHHVFWGLSNCNHSQDVGITCE